MNTYALLQRGRVICNLIVGNIVSTVNEVSTDRSKFHFLELESSETRQNMFQSAKRSSLKNNRVPDKIQARLARRVASLRS